MRISNKSFVIKTLDIAVRIPRTAKAADKNISNPADKVRERNENPTQHAIDEIQARVKSAGKQAVYTGYRAAKSVVRHGQKPRLHIPMKRKRSSTAENGADSAKGQGRLRCRTEYAAELHAREKAVNRTVRTREMRTSTDAANQATATLRNSSSQIAQKSAHVTQHGAKAAGKSVKTAQRSIKTAQKTVRTARKTVKATEKAALAVKKAAELARQATIKAMQAAKAAAQLAVKAGIAAVRATIAAVKALISAIAAGGWIALAVAALLALVYVLFFSPIGIFFSGENEDGQAVPEIISQIESDLSSRIDEIKARSAADVVVIDVEGDALINNWREILAVFAVKTAMDDENAVDVFTLDDERVVLLKKVFWDMCELTYTEETSEEVRQTIKSDGTLDTEVITTKTLTISITCKSADSMALEYGFGVQQNELLEVMLSPDFRELFNALIGADGGIPLTEEQLRQIYNDLPVGSLGAEIVKIALSRLGDPYSQPLRGKDDYVDCSYLVRWVFGQLGISLPTYAAAQAEFCVNNGLTISKDDLAPGDLIFFSHYSNGRYMNITHVAIYAGDGMIVDASSKRGEVVYRKLIGGAVIYARATTIANN